MAELQCRNFNGYKPCGKHEICDSLCPHRDIVTSRILVVHLEALGAVVRATSLLPAIRRKFPGSHITWVTQKPADQLLKNNPFLDRVLTTQAEDLLVLNALEFDFAFVVDKSLKASGVLAQTFADVVYGFVADRRSGAIVPATPAGEELWEIGLNDHKKLFENKKTETQLLCEAMELEYRRDPYVLKLTEAERAASLERKKMWRGRSDFVLGINTGCANTIPHKKLTVEYHRKLIMAIKSHWGESVRVVLLGGKEDSERNRQIAENLDVVLSSTDQGIRDGAISIEACDLILTGDSLGMHMGIALKKWVIAWFGPTCAHEIDLYEMGEAILSQAGCSPCWKRLCHREPMCYDLVRVDDFIKALEKGIQWLQTSSSFKLPSSEMSY